MGYEKDYSEFEKMDKKPTVNLSDLLIEIIKQRGGFADLRELKQDSEWGGYFEDEMRSSLKRLEEDGLVETRYDEYGKRHYGLTEKVRKK